SPLAGQALDLTARGSGPFVVYVDGDSVSAHTAEREAVERVSRELAAKPTARVYYVHRYTVDAVLVGAPTSSTPPPPPADTSASPPHPPAQTAGPDVYVHLDWSPATGTSKRAIMDEGKARPFNYVEGLASANSDACPSFRVLSTQAEGRDYPTPNF